MDQLIIPKLIFFFILMTYLVGILLILEGEILTWSLMGVQGLIDFDLLLQDSDYLSAITTEIHT